MSDVRISVFVLAFEAAAVIRDCIASADWADEVIVVDSHSTDDTAKIAESLGARVVQIEFKGFGPLRNAALEHCRGDWIVSLDADERCTPEVRDEILAITASGDPPHCAYRIPRRNFFLGRWILHSGWFPDFRQPQLFQRGGLRYGPEPVHEGFELQAGGSLGTLRNAIWQVPYGSLEELNRKVERYSTLGADRLIASGRRASPGLAIAHGSWAFLRQYFFQRGFLDGWPGFVLAVSRFEGVFYKYAKAHARRVDLYPSEPPAPKTPRTDRDSRVH